MTEIASATRRQRRKERRKEIHPSLLLPLPLHPPVVGSKKPIVENRAKGEEGRGKSRSSLFCCSLQKKIFSFFVSFLLFSEDERSVAPPPPPPSSFSLLFPPPSFPPAVAVAARRERGGRRGFHLLGGKGGLAQWVLFVLSTARKRGRPFPPLVWEGGSEEVGPRPWKRSGHKERKGKIQNGRGKGRRRRSDLKRNRNHRKEGRKERGDGWKRELRFSRDENG